MKLLFYTTITMLLTSIALHSQSDTHYWYTSTGFDANKAFHIKDNPRTLDDHYGLDWTVETGFRTAHNWGMHIFYGKFNDGGFKRYGFGLNWYIPNTVDWLELSLGPQLSVLKQKDGNGNYDTVGAYAVRGTIYFKPFKKIGFNIGFISQLHHRNDVTKHFVMENAISLKYTFGTDW